MCCKKETLVINLDLFWKQVFCYRWIPILTGVIILLNFGGIPKLVLSFGSIFGDTNTNGIILINSLQCYLLLTVSFCSIFGDTTTNGINLSSSDVGYCKVPMCLRY